LAYWAENGPHVGRKREGERKREKVGWAGIERRKFF